MAKVYDLWFMREYAEREATQLHIGIYSTEAAARAAVEALTDKPGFRDFPEGFEIHQTPLDETEWREGYLTKYGPPPKDVSGVAFDLPVWAGECETWVEGKDQGER